MRSCTRLVVDAGGDIENNYWNFGKRSRAHQLQREEAQSGKVVQASFLEVYFEWTLANPRMRAHCRVGADVGHGVGDSLLRCAEMGQRGR